LDLTSQDSVRTSQDLVRTSQASEAAGTNQNILFFSRIV
jgi:hypothetical protein